MSADACPAVRRRGRPARISRDQIVREALAQLESEGFDAFSLPRLGRRMAVSPMAVYKHFAGRDAILDAVAREIALQFRFEPSGDKSGDDLLLWFGALFDLFERFPVAMALLKLDDVSTAWLRVWAPLALTLSRMGLSKGRLSFATSWVTSVAMGLVMVHHSPTWQTRTALFTKTTGIDPIDAVLSEVDQYFDRYDKRQLLDFGALCAVESIRKRFADDSASSAP